MWANRSLIMPGSSESRYRKQTGVTISEGQEGGLVIHHVLL